MDKTAKNKIIPSSLDDVKGMLEPKTNEIDKGAEDKTDPNNPVDEHFGGSLKTIRSKKLKELKLNFNNIKHL